MTDRPAAADLDLSQRASAAFFAVQQLLAAIRDSESIAEMLLQKNSETGVSAVVLQDSTN